MVLSVEVQRELYARFIIPGSDDELNLTANVTKPLHSAYSMKCQVDVSELWIPVYKEVVRMVLENCFRDLASVNYVDLHQHSTLELGVQSRVASIKAASVGNE